MGNQWEKPVTYIRLGWCRHCDYELILEWDNVSDNKGYCYVCYFCDVEYIGLPQTHIQFNDDNDYRLRGVCSRCSDKLRMRKGSL